MLNVILSFVSGVYKKGKAMTYSDVSNI